MSTECSCSFPSKLKNDDYQSKGPAVQGEADA